MSWFEEQLRTRASADDAEFAHALDTLAGAVMGSRLKHALSDKEIANSAVEQILKYYHCKIQPVEMPDNITTVEAQVDFRMRPFGILSRTVELDKGWYRQAVGAMLGKTGVPWPWCRIPSMGIRFLMCKPESGCASIGRRSNFWIQKPSSSISHCPKKP